MRVGDGAGLGDERKPFLEKTHIGFNDKKSYPSQELSLPRGEIKRVGFKSELRRLETGVALKPIWRE
jgi:hypothetical protein